MWLISVSLFHLYLDLHANWVITGQLALLRLGSSFCQWNRGSCLPETSEEFFSNPPLHPTQSPPPAGPVLLEKQHSQHVTLLIRDSQWFIHIKKGSLRVINWLFVSVITLNAILRHGSLQCSWTYRALRQVCPRSKSNICRRGWNWQQRGFNHS